RAGRDHDPVGIGKDTARTSEVPGKFDSQLLEPARIDVAEVGVGRSRQSMPQRSQPNLTREAPEVGLMRAKVIAHLLNRSRRRGPGDTRLRKGNPAHTRVRTLAKIEIALCSELRVGPHHDAAGNADVLRKRAGRRQVAAGRQGAGSDRASQLLLELPSKLSTPRAIELDEQVTGLKLARAHVMKVLLGTA